jgi:acetyltransferase
MGGAAMANAEAVLNRAGIPAYPFPDTAAQVFAAVALWGDTLRALYETPALAEDPEHAVDPDAAHAAIARAQAAGRTTLDPDEAAHLLAAYALPLAPADEPPPPGSFSLRISSAIDPVFGPFLALAPGDPWADLDIEPALALPPLNSTLARRALERSRLLPAFARHGVDLDGLAQLLVRLGRLVAEQHRVARIALDPMDAPRGRLLVRRANVELHPPDLPDDRLPRTVIAPYPQQYVETITLRDGSPALIRPIRPEDEPLLRAFHATLSDTTVYLRYFQALKLSQRVAHDRLARLCFVDYGRETALVVERTDPATGQPAILGVGRLTRHPRRPEGEFAVILADAHQRQGLGLALLTRLVAIARDLGLARIGAEMLLQNVGMQRVAQAAGFALTRIPEDGIVRADLDLARQC